MRERCGGFRTLGPLRGQKHLTLESCLRTASFRSQTICSLDKPPKSRSQSRRFIFLLPRQGLADGLRAALCARYDDTRAAPPVVGCLFPTALLKIERGEVVERRGHIGMVRAERFLTDGKSALIERLCLLVAAHVLMEPREIVERRSHRWMGRA
ncbi:hypothetical protein MnTg02_02639 [bacterium MnTg02]|nr:hypothetical protein MnTg02_02639 [bacterium MnTg02]